MKKAKKQKYIRERSNCYEINIAAYDQKYNERIAFKKFDGDKKTALEYAIAVRDQKLIEMRSGYTATDKTTVKSLFDQSYELIPQEYETKRKHEIIYKQCLTKFSDTEISKITAEDIQRNLNTYAETQSKSQVSRLLAVWRRIYKTAAKKGIRVYDATQAVDVPKNCVYKPKKSNIIDQKDYEEFMENLWKYNNDSVTGKYRSRIIYYAIRVMEHTGMRPAEVYCLERRDINLVTNEISVNKALHNTKDGKGKAGRTKTESSIRTIPISKQLKPILIELLQFSKNAYVFSDYNGCFISSKDQCTLLGNVSKKCKIKFRQYMSRHEFSKKSLEAGVSPHDLRDLMGHTSATMSIYYAESTPESRREAIEKINQKERLS